jgi:hypothetical protein
MRVDTGEPVDGGDFALWAGPTPPAGGYGMEWVPSVDPPTTDLAGGILEIVQIVCIPMKVNADSKKARTLIPIDAERFSERSDAGF